MKRIDTTLDQVRHSVRGYYKENQHHYVAMNGVDVGDGIEVQWIFQDYKGEEPLTMFVAKAAYTDIVPSLNDIIPSAWVTEAEFVDMFAVEVENAKKGFFLESENAEPPMRKTK